MNTLDERTEQEVQLDRPAKVLKTAHIPGPRQRPKFQQIGMPDTDAVVFTPSEPGVKGGVADELGFIHQENGIEVGPEGFSEDATETELENADDGLDYDVRNQPTPVSTLQPEVVAGRDAELNSEESSEPQAGEENEEFNHGSLPDDTVQTELIDRIIAFTDDTKLESPMKFGDIDK